MRQSNHIVVLGSGHLAFQVARKLRAMGFAVLEIGSDRFQSARKFPAGESAVEHFRRTLCDSGIDSAQAVYVLDDEDRYNIQFTLIVLSLNESVPIMVSLFNPELSVHLQASSPKIAVRSPASAASTVFVRALRSSPARQAPRAWLPPSLIKPLAVRQGKDRWLIWLVAAFVGLLACGTAVFHNTEQLSWLDAFYFTVTLMTTTGFGDISLRNSSAFAKLFGAALMLSAVGLLSLTFSFIVDRLFKRRAEIALGRRHYRLANHVIVCGLGRVGYEVSRELLRQKETVLVIEKDPENRFLTPIQALGARTFVGDASVPKVLEDAGVNAAGGLFSLIDDDLKNLEIGLNARALRADLRLILRIFDKEIAEPLSSRLDIHFALSTSVVAAEEFVGLLETPSQATQAPSSGP
jgi:Trk K+ transport system NAD-binding subunit